MAQNVIVICGRWCADWYEVSKIAASFNIYLEYVDEIMEASLSDQPEEFWTFRRTAALLEELKRLHLSKDRSATDPWDKIYAFLGIPEELSRHGLLKVDYIMTVCELYMQVCQILYEETKSLGFLSMVERTRIQNQDQQFNLPSWNPNWAVRINMNSLFRDRSHPLPRSAWSASNPKPRAFSEKFAFTGNSTANGTFDFALKKLAATGFIVDTIIAIQQHLKDLIPNFSSAGLSTYGKRICLRAPSLAEEFEGNTIWLTRLKPVHPLEKPTDRTVEKLEGEAQKDSFLDVLTFATETHHHLGVTDATIQPGDSVCALLGGNVLYILCIIVIIVLFVQLSSSYSLLSSLLWNYRCLTYD
jgi:hypothetical protein